MNVMFIHVPKAAGISIEKSLGLIRARTTGRFNKLFTGKGKYSFGHIDVRKRLRSGAISQDFYRTAFKFCICRNPYDRAVSHYFYARKKHPDKFSPSVSFIDFTRTLGDYGKMFQRQTYYTDGIDFDFIGRFECIGRTYQYVSEKIGVTAELVLDNTTAHLPYWKYYCPETRENIVRFYRKDFEFFGYDEDDHFLH